LTVDVTAMKSQGLPDDHATSLKMEAARPSERLVSCLITKWCLHPEDHGL